MSDWEVPPVQSLRPTDLLSKGGGIQRPQQRKETVTAGIASRRGAVELED